MCQCTGLSRSSHPVIPLCPHPTFLPLATTPSQAFDSHHSSPASTFRALRPHRQNSDTHTQTDLVRHTDTQTHTHTFSVFFPPQICSGLFAPVNTEPQTAIIDLYYTETIQCETIQLLVNQINEQQDRHIGLSICGWFVMMAQFHRPWLNCSDSCRI